MSEPIIARNSRDPGLIPDYDFCAGCGSFRLDQKPTSLVTRLATWTYIMVPWLRHSKRWYCRDCGRELQGSRRPQAH